MVPRFLFCAVLLACTGCISAYAPSMPIAPLLRESGSLAAGGLVSALPQALGASGYVAAAPTPSLRVYASGTLTRARLYPRADYSEPEDAPAYNRSAQGELAAGYAHVGRLHTLDLLGGAGAGRTRAQECYFHIAFFYFDDCRQSAAHFGKVFGQFDVAGGTRTVTAGLGLRLTLTHQVATELNDEPSSRRIWLPAIEPFAVLRFGPPWLQGELQFNWPFLATPDEAAPYAQLPRLALGLRVTLEHLWT